MSLFPDRTDLLNSSSRLLSPVLKIMKVKDDVKKHVLGFKKKHSATHLQIVKWSENQE